MTYRIRISHVRGTVRGTVQLTVRTRGAAIVLARAEGARMGPGWILEILGDDNAVEWRIAT